jgi:hypothetical protein
MPSVQERFDAKWMPEPNTGCHLWTAATFRTGYGQFAHRSAHRVAYELARGDIPEGLDVLHHCDTPSCVNPAHLFLGTHAENMADMARKGRAKPRPPGYAGRAAKLTSAEVLAVREAAMSGVSQKELASRYGVDPSLVSLVVNRKIWRYV